MERLSKVSKEAYVEQMREATETMLHGVIGAVNRARDGAWINESEMQVRDLLADYRRKAYETAIEMRTDASEAAFSPGRQKDGTTAAQEGSVLPKHRDG
jgi:hypothetical protein